MHLLGKRYPRALDNRLPYSHPSRKATRTKFFKAATLNFAILQLTFFALFCYLFGSLYQQGPRTHHMKIVWVDYDGGVIGQAVRNGDISLQAPTFPTLVEESASTYPTPNSLYEAVCNADYWGALYTVSGSSTALGLTIAGSNTTAYNQSNVLFYIWNEARYPTVVDAAVSGSLNTLSNTARVAYIRLNGTGALSTLPSDNEAALDAFTNPWILTSINIKPTQQGSRAVYNTIVIVLILMQDFFYLANINGLYAQFKIYTRAGPATIILIRELISCIYTMVGAMLVSAAIWAFKADWPVSGTQFALTWLTMWIFAHVNFLMLDVFTIWIPPVYVSLALVIWVIINVTSIIIPFDLSSPFYRWGYALPAHAAYEVLTDVWSGGCNPHLYFALPVLFSYEVVATAGAAVGVYKRCHAAALAEEAGKEALSLRREQTRKLEGPESLRERRKSSMRAPWPSSVMGQGSVAEQGGAQRAEDNGDLELEGSRQREEEEEKKEEDRRAAWEIQRLETRASRVDNFPAFQLIGSGDDSD